MADLITYRIARCFMPFASLSALTVAVTEVFICSHCILYFISFYNFVV